MANDVRHANCPLQDDLEFTLTPLNNVQKNTYNIRDGSSLSSTRPDWPVYQTESGYGLTRDSLLWQKCWSSSSSIHIGLNMTDVCIWWVHDKWIQMAAFGIHNYICIYWWITFKYNAYRISKIVFYIWSFLQRIGWLSTVSECSECGSVMILLLSCIACPYSFHTRSFCLKL